MTIIKLASNKSPRVSWLICSNTEEKIVYEALNSCINQIYDDLEIIFICNGAIGEKLAQDLSVKYFDEKRLSIYYSNLKYLTHSLNLGLDLCRGELVARMDADDISLPNRLECQVNFMDTHSEVIVLGSSYTIIDSNGIILRNVKLPLNNNEIRKKLFWGNPICHPSVIYRKEAIMQLGGYMGGIQAEDYDLWLRLSENKSNIFASLDDCLILYRNSSKNKTRKSIQAYASVGSAQFQRFIKTFNIKWLLGSILTVLKRIINR